VAGFHPLKQVVIHFFELQPAFACCKWFFNIKKASANFKVILLDQ
jgi:hypothetical protein